MQSVLVTGGAGFVGAHLVRRLLDEPGELRVVTLDLLTYAGSLDNLADLPAPDRHTFVHGDVCDLGLVRELVLAHQVDTVIHAAAETHVDRSISGPWPFLRTNVEGTASVLEGARAAWEEQAPPLAPRVHVVGTDEVYGDREGMPVAKAGDAYAPSSPYAASKAAADHLVHAWGRTFGVPATVSHGCNTYGPRQFPEKLIPVVIRAALAGRPIPLYGDGAQVREWLHVDDHCEGILAACRHPAAGATYLLSSGEARTNRALVEQICAVLDELVPDGAPHARAIRSVDDRPGHDRRYAIDPSGTRAALGWAPRRALDEALPETVAWYVDAEAVRN